LNSIDARIRELVAHAYEKAPAVRQIFEQAGITPADIQSASDLVKIPVLSKDSLVEIHQKHPPFGGFLTIDAADLPRIYISPGPIFDPQPTPEDPQMALAPFRYVGFTRGDRVLNTFAYHLTPAGMLIDEALRLCGATVLPTGPGNTDLQIQMALALGATGFVGQPSYLMTILDKVQEMGITAERFPIRKALFAAEPYTPTQQKRFESEWGMKTTSAYGTADLGIIGYSVSGVPGFLVTSNVWIEIVDPQSGQTMPAGETGEIMVTTFNKAYPLIRFGTGDLGALGADPVNGSQHLLGLFGRSGDAVKVRGMFLHPNQLRFAAMQFPQIERLQAVITRDENRDIVTIRIQLKEGASGEGVAENLQQLAQAAVRLRIDEVIFEAVDPNERAIRDERSWE
jgi:phenylacetate-CoA ligase